MLQVRDSEFFQERIRANPLLYEDVRQRLQRYLDEKEGACAQQAKEEAGKPV